MPKVFISYRRDDTGGHAGHLYERLKREFGEDHVFMDVVTLTPGVDFRHAIQERLSVCNAIVVLIGQRWLSPVSAPRLFEPDDVLRVELETALDERIRIVPVLADGASMPAASQLPTSIQALARKHAHELTARRWESDADDLVKVLRRHELPPLDRRDIDAVRAFHPGKLIGRVAALLSLVLIILGYMGAVDRIGGWLGSGLNAWVRGGLIFGMPIVAVVSAPVIEVCRSPK